MDRIGITLGDVTGVGPEVTLKALAALSPTDSTKYLLIGDRGYVTSCQDSLGISLAISDYAGPNDDNRITIFDPLAEPLPRTLPNGSSLAARAALEFLRVGAQFCIRGELSALITAPVNKESILRTGESFVGQTEFLAGQAGTARFAMMLLGADDRNRWLRVALVTTHLPLRRVADEISQIGVETTIELAAEACLLLNLPRQRIAVCGLNPHAGEGGKLGTEDQEIIAPAVRTLQSRGVQVTGPLAADTVFYSAFRGDFDAIVAMYHDQGLGPLKMIGFEKGVNWTLGLPFVRTSPDHGTAYDIAGKGIANPSSMLAAIQLAQVLCVRNS